MPDEFKDFPGIDTSYERSKIEYKPVLEYVKDTRLVEQEEAEIDDGLLLAKIMPPAEAHERTENLAKGFSDLQSLLEKRLANVSVVVDPSENPNASNALQNIGVQNNTITFPMYKQALFKNDSDSIYIAEAYEDAHSGIDGKIEVEAYQIVVANKLHWENHSKFLKEVIPNDKKLDEDILNEWSKQEREKAKIESKLSSLIADGKGDSLEAAIEEEKLSIFKIYLEEFNNHPYQHISRATHHKADFGEKDLQDFKTLVNRTVSDRIGGDVACFIKAMLTNSVRIKSPSAPINIKGPDIIYNLSASQNRLRAVDTPPDDSSGDSTSDLKSAILNAIKLLEAVCLLLTYKLTKETLGMKAVKGQLLGILGGALQPVQQAIVRAVSRLSTEISNPVRYWLSNVAKTTSLSNCMPFEDFAEILFDAVEDVEESFNDIIMDFFKFSNQASSIQRQLMEQLKEKEQYRTYFKILNQVIKELERLYSDPKVLSVEDIDFTTLKLISENRWDETYDRIEDRVKKIISEKKESQEVPNESD